jgi:hypothetical protein
MNQMSREYWEQRYRAGDMPWEKGAPVPGLVDFLAAHPDLPRGTVGVPGCGTGHDVRAWAQAGFNTFGCDIAPGAVQQATEKTKADSLSPGALALPGGGNTSFQLADFLRDEPPFQFDWLFEHTLFCAINPAERDDYVRAVLRWLKPEGQYLAVHYLILEDDNGPPFPVARDEVVRRFSPHFDLVEDWIPRSYPNRTGCERMFWWRRNPNTR